MKVFLSSTFVDLAEEREAVLLALRKRGSSTRAMEDFLATPTTPEETALSNLRDSDLMILIIGNKAGSLLPDGSGGTYTSAEYEELLKLGREAIVFVKERKRRFWSRRPSWWNAEKDPTKKKALDGFKATVGARWTWDTFSTPDQLALGVIQSIDRWEAKGRPGARKTFSSVTEYFPGKNPGEHFHLLDFGITLFGRDEQIQFLRDFTEEPSQRVCILSGRGGIGKSKILHDWAETNLDSTATMFLKDEPLWHEDSDKELPIDTKTVVVDDAHRQESFGRLLQLIHDLSPQRNIKLIVSTRPGSATRLTQQIFRRIDPAQVTQLPELQELSTKQSRALAEMVLGTEFRQFAHHLAYIGSNSPLVIVAGGRFIATRKVHPSTLTNLKEFRSTIFNRVLEEMDLEGAKFAINPPLPVLQLIAALGPVDVERGDFQESAATLLGRPIDEILATIDVLASNGIITPRPKPVRILPDVLSDYILEDRAIGSGSRSTHYADRVYLEFGRHSLRGLMRNLAELDWRLGQSGESGLNLLDDIWSDIHQRFWTADEYTRKEILTDLSGAAVYQPGQVVTLIRTSFDLPIVIGDSGQTGLYRAGQELVLSALPNLLEATAYHPDWLTESVTTLWELAKRNSRRNDSAGGAQDVIKRLASWQRFGNAAMNFAMLVQAIRLSQRPDAFVDGYTPYAIIQQILERDGEFNEWQDENTILSGGFGLNYAAVGPTRDSALDYLEFALEGDGRPAILVIGLLEGLLHNFLNRVGRISTHEEEEWQNRERERCLRMLLDRFRKPSSVLLRARIYDAVRSATAIQCPKAVREKAGAALAEICVDGVVAVVDAICTADHELPLLSAEFDEAEWQKPIIALMAKGWASLASLTDDLSMQARIVIDETVACVIARVKTGGFHRFIQGSTDRPDLLGELADQLASHPRIGELVDQYSSVLAAIRSADPTAFRNRALAFLRNGQSAGIYAAANNLRIFDRPTLEDIAVIHAFGTYPDPVAKRGALFAIAYMGKFVELRPQLKSAVLATHVSEDPTLAQALADALGPYGIPLTDFTREEAAAICLEFLPVKDWNFGQGAIPRFLNGFVNIFPDETFDLLVRRIDLGSGSHSDHLDSFRTVGLVYQGVSFGGVGEEKRIQLGHITLARLISASDVVGDYAKLFWDVAGYDHRSLRLIIDAAPTADKRGVRNIARLIDEAVPRFAFTNLPFVRDLLQCLTSEDRGCIVDAFARQARRFGSGVFAGHVEDYLATRDRQFAEQLAKFPGDPDLRDLARALHHSA